MCEDSEMRKNWGPPQHLRSPCSHPLGQRQASYCAPVRTLPEGQGELGPACQIASSPGELERTEGQDGSLGRPAPTPGGPGR